MLRIVTALFFYAALSLTAAAAPNLGPAVGDKLPVPLTSQDQMGAPRDFDNLRGRHGLVLIFSRSLEWCPYCQRQAIEAKKHAATFASMGLPLVVLTYDPAEKLARFAKRQAISYTLISDQRSRIIDGFGLRNEEYGLDSVAYGVPHPAIFIIDDQGVIRAKLIEEGYITRPSIDDVLNAARPLAKP